MSQAERQVFKAALLLADYVPPETPEFTDRTGPVDGEKTVFAQAAVGSLSKVLCQADQVGDALAFRRDALSLVG